MNTNRICPACGGPKAFYAKHCMKCRLPIKHGLSYEPEYKAWQTMRLRCIEPTNQAYPDYGGRGITVCARWLRSVEDFMADMGQKPAPEYEIDRKKNDGGYWCGKCPECLSLGRPSNCHWTTRSENDRNRRGNRHLEFRGETKTLAEWSSIFSIPRDTLAFRLRKGWEIEAALTTPVRMKAENGALEKRCVKCKGRGEVSVRNGPHGWHWEPCACVSAEVAP